MIQRWVENNTVFFEFIIFYLICLNSLIYYDYIDLNTINV